MNELVSIIIPAYNAEKTIIRCLESIKRQTYQRIEIIVINDGSSDQTGKILSEYVRENNQEKKYKVISQDNKGVAETRNIGILNATGEYVTFVDADDYLSEDAVEHMLKKAQKTDAVLVIANHIRHEKTKTVTFKSDLPELLSVDEGVKALLKKNIRVGCVGKLYSTIWLKDRKLFFPTDRYGEDIYHLFNSILSDGKMAWLNEAVYHVVDTENSICNSFSIKFLGLMDTLDEMQTQLIRMNLWRKHEKEFKEYYLSQVKYLLNYGIRFDKKDFLSIVLERNHYKSGQLKIGWNKGFLTIVDDMLFNANKKAYVGIKLYRRKRKR